MSVIAREIRRQRHEDQCPIDNLTRRQWRRYLPSWADGYTFLSRDRAGNEVQVEAFFFPEVIPGWCHMHPDEYPHWALNNPQHVESPTPVNDVKE